MTKEQEKGGEEEKKRQKAVSISMRTICIPLLQVQYMDWNKKSSVYVT